MFNLTYVYNASGQKLRKINNGTSTEYISGIQYTIWTSVEPLAEQDKRWSPYTFGDPIRFTDPDGRAPEDEPTL